MTVPGTTRRNPKPPVQDGRWHHVVGTMQAVAPRAGGSQRPGQSYLYRIYVDGQLDAEQTGTLGCGGSTTREGGILKIAYPELVGGRNGLTKALWIASPSLMSLSHRAQVKARFEAGRGSALLAVNSIGGSITRRS